MASLDELGTALINADKAGDIEAAKTLAGEIQRVRGMSAPSQGQAVTNMTPQQAAIADMKARPWGSGVPKALYEFGGKVTDLASNVGASPNMAAGIGAGANFLGNAASAFLTSGSLVGAAPTSVLGYPARWLMQTAVKPSIADLRSGDAGRAINTMFQENIYPTSSGMNKAARITGQLDRQVETAISNSPANVNVEAVGSPLLRGLYPQARNQVNPQGDINAVRNAWDEFRASPQVAGQNEIPVQTAQALKKGTYQALGGKSYGEVGSTATEAQKALARGLREEVAKAVPEVSEPLARQAALMNVRSVAGNRALLEASKNPLGLAALRMDDPLSALSFLADRWGWLKAFAAMQAHAAGQPQTFAPLGMALSSPRQSQPALLQQLGVLARPND